uniref:Trafficking protein particle complex subunit 13 n=1 Tax=Cricetulus griseus TaxID=10029 RepID=A0A8C2M2E7_CRIGR
MEVNPLKQEHLLALKVMRLTKPTLFTNIPPGDLFNQLMRDDPSTVNGAEILMLGEMLTLPQIFGNIFLGETFPMLVLLSHLAGSKYLNYHQLKGRNRRVGGAH